jgi:hypothetical protein
METMDVSSPPCLPFDAVPVVVDHDIDAIGMAVSEPVAEPETPVAAKDQVAVSIDVVNVPLTSPTCSAKAAAVDAKTMVAKNFMLVEFKD